MLFEDEIEVLEFWKYSKTCIQRKSCHKRKALVLTMNGIQYCYKSIESTKTETGLKYKISNFFR